jgi:phenylacetate-coenzyme A ligase PaaK-like adenylate-forming protein
MELTEFLTLHPYSLDKTQKSLYLNALLSDLTKYHYNNNNEYKKIINAEKFIPVENYDYLKIPFIPVRLFKMFDLYSTEKSAIIKTMTSSGTTGNSVSKIFLDKVTSANQTRALTKTISSFIGKERIPMLIIDSEATVSNTHYFSARTAGILGFSIFGSKKTYALNDIMELNTEAVLNFFKENKNKRVFLFGFTFIVWEHFYKELLKKGIIFDLSNSILIHGGGWKKLIDKKVSSDIFKQRLRDVCGINEIYDYYGMVEQTGSVYMECEFGHLHAPIYSDVIIRRSFDFSPAEIGEKGLIQVVSVLPFSYPGHSLLTEDEGVLLGEDDCPCGRLGKYFAVIGRVKNAEIRGCSDVYEGQI